MYDEFKNIYEMLYSNIITPFNLLENSKLPNYSYVKYFKGNDGLIVEMECLMDNMENTLFSYHFDSNDKLIKIIKLQNNIEETVFDRNKELEKALHRYKSKKHKSNKAIV